MNGVGQGLDWPAAEQRCTAAGGPRSGAQAGQDDDSELHGYYVGECGHRVPLVGAAGWHIGPCDDCDDPSPASPSVAWPPGLL